jgi:exosortase/archaeosortase family protein
MSKTFIRFIIWTVGLYLVWFGLYEFILKPNGKLDHLLSEYISIVTCYLLNLSDYQAYYTIGKKLGETYVFIGDGIMPIVRIGASCNGLEMLVIFSIFIACYPGNRMLKFVFMLGGIFLLHSLNIFRNYILTLLAINRSSYFELFHRYVFIFLIYGVIFLLWMWWANRLSHLYLKSEN